uniref:Uncharacterized protein n=1 Tax=Tetradesmus obliquus TaxID=3088 RepID=A0A383VD24_TETOB|eukprot:jgi/Sobl393_1/2119/SZX62843.1
MPKLNTCTDTAAAADAAPTLLPPPLIPTIRHQPQVLIHNCNLSNSSSGDGGAVAAWGTAYVVVHDSRIKFSSATDRGGGVCFNENSRGNLIRLLLTNNSAGLEGGGLAVYDSAKVNATGVMFQANSAKFGGGMMIGGKAEMILSNSTQPPGKYNITFKLVDYSSVKPAILSLRVSPCIRGEFAPSQDTCQVCLPGSYSLHPSQQACQPCPPAGADCPGGAAILPMPGWWHSAGDSAQMHR